MLTPQEIKTLIESDYNSDKKAFARIGRRYYEGDHDIRRCRIFFIDKDGKVQEDTTKSNARICRPFFAELVDHAAQYQLSNKEAFVKSDDPQLQEHLDRYFNDNEDFRAELHELLVGRKVDGDGYFYAYKRKDGRTDFQYAESGGVVEVRKHETDDGCEYVIYWYVDRIGKDNKKIKRIQVWDDKQVSFFVQVDDGQITPDVDEKPNPRPHIIYKKDGDDATYYDVYGLIPFFRLDNNRKRISSLKRVKDHIDDYDLMNCGLTNNIQDAAEVLVVVRGFDGDDLDELMQNMKAKKHIGTPDPNSNVEYRTIDIPVEARVKKMEIDVNNIYCDGRGVNIEALKDSNATVSVAIKTAYFRLDLDADETETRLKQFMRKILDPVLSEINKENETDYQQGDVYFDFSRESITNAQEMAQIALLEAQKRNMEITSLLNIQTQLDHETLMQLICEQLDIDYEEIKDKLPKPEDDALYAPAYARTALAGILPEDEAPEDDAGGDLIE